MTTGTGALVRFSAVFLVTAVIAASGCNRTEVSPTDRVRPETPDLVRALRALGTKTGSVALVRTDAGIERDAFGEAEPGRPADPKDRFHIQSTTKTFVATVVLQLVGEQRLSLRDTVGDLLPGVLRAVRPITVRKLLNHSSGLVGDSIGPPAPGTHFYYSNANYVLLGQIVEEVTGRPLERVVLNRIFRPLDLKDSSYGTAAVGSPDEGPWLGYPVVRYPASGPIRGNAGIVSTVDDVATFFAALLGGKLLRPDLMADMTHTIEGEEGYRVGLGIFRRELSCGVARGPRRLEGRRRRPELVWLGSGHIRRRGHLLFLTRQSTRHMRPSSSVDGRIVHPRHDRYREGAGG